MSKSHNNSSNSVTDNKKPESTASGDVEKYNIEKYYQDAERYIKSSKYADAAKALVKVLEIDGYHANAQYRMGFIYEFCVKRTSHDVLKEAVKWYTSSAANGHKKADKALARVLDKISKKTGLVAASVANIATVSAYKKNV